MPTEQERTVPPYISVGFPITPARPGAEHTRTRSEFIGFCLDVLAGYVPIPLVGQGEVDEGPEITFEIANVVAASFSWEQQGIDRQLHLDQGFDGSRQLDFTLAVRKCPGQRFKYDRAENVAGGHSQLAGKYREAASPRCRP